MTKLYVMLRNFLGDQRGVSAIEYAILAGIIVVIVAAAIIGFGDGISELFGNANEGLQSVVTESNAVGEPPAGP